MHRLCVSAGLLVLLVTLAAHTQGKDTIAPFRARPPAFCLEPPHAGPCRALFTRFFFNASSGLCEDFIYGGCRGRQNRFPSKEECVETCGPRAPASEADTEAAALHSGPEILLHSLHPEIPTRVFP